MKIHKIEINKECDKHLVMSSGINLYPLVLTVHALFGTKEVKAYPTSIGPSNGEFILFYHFTDELGRKLPDKICKQCTNYCKSRRFHSTEERQTEAINNTES